MNLPVKSMGCFSNALVLLSDSYRKYVVTVQYVLKVILTGSKKQIISGNIWSPAHMHISCQTGGGKWKQMPAALQEKSSCKFFLNQAQQDRILLGQSREKLEGKAR